MKKFICCGSFFLFCLLACQVPFWASGQTTSDILENGIRIDMSNEMRFKFQDNSIKYQAFDKKRSSYFTLGDSLYFLSDRQVLIYITTLNPLNYSVDGQVKVTDDALSNAEDAGLVTVIGALKKMSLAPARTVAAADTTSFEDVTGKLDNLRANLDNGNKKAIAASFKQLKLISFDRPEDAKIALDQAKKDVDGFSAAYMALTNQVVEAQKAIDRYVEKGPKPTAHPPVC